LILGQLQELGSIRKEISVLESAIARDKEQDAREQELAVKELDVEKQRTALATEKAELWEQMYKSVTKKPGAGCLILRALTLGVHRCN